MFAPLNHYQREYLKWQLVIQLLFNWSLEMFSDLRLILRLALEPVCN